MFVSYSHNIRQYRLDTKEPESLVKHTHTNPLRTHEQPMQVPPNRICYSATLSAEEPGRRDASNWNTGRARVGGWEKEQK